MPDSVNKLEESEWNSLMINGGAFEAPFKKEEFLSVGIPIIDIIN